MLFHTQKKNNFLFINISKTLQIAKNENTLFF